LTLSHSRHISADRARGLGIDVTDLEDDQALQEAVLTVHHTCVQTLGATHAIKLIENHKGVAYVSGVQVSAVPIGTVGAPVPENAAAPVGGLPSNWPRS
jgi:hypothetical protein